MKSTSQVMVRPGAMPNSSAVTKETTVLDPLNHAVLATPFLSFVGTLFGSQILMMDQFINNQLSFSDMTTIGMGSSLTAVAVSGVAAYGISASSKIRNEIKRISHGTAKVSPWEALKMLSIGKKKTAFHLGSNEDGSEVIAVVSTGVKGIQMEQMATSPADEAWDTSMSSLVQVYALHNSPKKHHKELTS